MAEVFISHSSIDKEIAEMVCEALENNGIKCWMAPRDIVGGADWQPSITDAISESRVFIVIYSENSANSPQVARELALADDKSEHPRTIIPYKIDNTGLVAGFKYYLVSSHWVSADRSKNDFKTDVLLDSVNKALGRESTTNVTVNNVTINAVIHNDNRTAEPAINVVEVTPPPAQVAPGPIKISTKPPVNNFTPAPANVTTEKKPLPVKTIAIAGGALLAVILLIVLIISLSGGNNGAVSSIAENASSSVSQSGNTSASDGVVYYPDIKPYENNKAKVLENSYEETFMVLGKEYNTGIVLNAYAESYVIFNCDGYDKVKFTVARVDNTAKGENVIRVFADDKELNAVKTDQFSAPQTVEYDVSGKNQLRIAVLQSNSVRADIALTDICFYKDGEEIEENSSQESETADLVAVPSEKKPYENNKAEILDNSYEKSYLVLGKEYNTGIKLNAYEASYVIFDNSDGYETFYLTAGKVDNTNRGENYIRIYADDKELQPISFGQFSSPVSMEYDIKGAKQVRITVEQSNVSRADILLYNMYFAKNDAKPEIKVEDNSSLPDLIAVPAEKKPYENNKAELLDNSIEKSYLILGKEYNTGIKLNAYAASYVIFDNSDGYETLYLTAGKVDNTDRGENYIRIYADDKELQPISFGQFSSPVSMEYDIKGAKQVRITVEQSNVSRADILLYNMYFAKNDAKPEIKVEDNSSLPDLIAVPAEKKPYENNKAELLDNSIEKSYLILGKEYNTGIKLNAYAASYVIFDNSDGYETLYLTAGKVDNTDRGENYIRIYADDKELQPISFGQFSSPVSMEYDIKGAKQIRIASEQSNTSRADILLYNMYFGKNGKKPEIKEEEVNAPDLVAVTSDKNPYEKNRVELLDNSFEKSYLILGKEHNTGIMLNANDGSYIIFDNSEGYETLYLTAAKTDNTSRGDNYIRVYADDKEMEIMSFGKFSSPVSMEYDIKGAKQIRIAVEQNHSSPAIMLLYDIYFAKNGKKPEIKEEEVNAPDLVAVPSEKTPYEHFKSEVFTNSLDKKYYVLGKEYNTGIMLDANEGGYIIFDNSEGYETLYLTISKIDDTAKGENRIVIYEDGKELDSIELVQPSTPLVKEYDIKGVKQIRIAADVNHSSPAKILLYDTYFSKNGAKPQQ